MNFDLEAINQASRNTVMETLDIRVTEVSMGRVVATMPVTSKVHQPLGLLHGGVSVVLAETVASYGGWCLVADQGKVVVGQEINANHLKSVKSGMVQAVGAVIHQGYTSQVWEIKITNDKNELICISRCTLAVVDKK